MALIPTIIDPTSIIPYAVAATDALIPRYGVIKPEKSDTPVFSSYLGTPVYDQLVLFPLGAAQVAGISDAVVLQTVLMEINQQKVLVKTQITGRTGAVKEYISDDDYRITIRGAIVSPYGNYYPKEDAQKLLRYLQVQGSLAASSQLLKIFGIDNIVIESYNIADKMGTRNMIPFEIYACSDLPIEFSLI